MKAFTLIELIVWITISMLLMTSIWIFMSNGIGIINKQKKIIENSNDFVRYFSDIQDYLKRWISWSPYHLTSSWAFFLTQQKYQNGGITYIGETTLSGAYCESDSEYSQTKHLFTSSFIPFEESGEDIITQFWDILTSQDISFNGEIYHSDQNNHSIIDGSWNIIAWRWVFGDTLIPWDLATRSYLNRPTWLATDGNVLFIADTLNHRVVYLDASWNIHQLLGRNDGLNQPTGLYYNPAETSLYIANSWDWEILQYSSHIQAVSPSFRYSYSGSTLNNINRFRINLFENRNISNITSSPWVSDFWFNNISSNIHFSATNNNSLNYYFTSNYNSSSTQGECPGSGMIITSVNQPVNCISTGTGQTLNTFTQSIDSWDEIVINNLAVNSSSTGSYFAQIDFLNNNSVIYSDYIPYFEQSDGNILTKNDNTLSIVESGLNYPTGIWWIGIWNRREFLAPARDFTNLQPIYQKGYDSLLNSPIEQTQFAINNHIFTFNLEYYKQLNCYNRDDKISRDIFFSKNIK